MVLILASLALAGCGHGFSDNMAQQKRYDAYERNSFFADDGASRQLVPGTVPRIAFHVGHAPRLTQAQFDHLDPAPPKRVTLGLLLRGEQRFNIYCAPCHGRDGYADGMVVHRGYPSPPVLWAPRLRKASDGHIYDVITHGLGKMPPYGGLVPVPDRWAIIAYVRALQLSQHAPASDAPPAVREKLFSETSTHGVSRRLQATRMSEARSQGNKDVGVRGVAEVAESVSSIERPRRLKATANAITNTHPHKETR